MLYEDKKFVVTGGGGFIGSNVVSLLNRIGCSNIIIVDHITRNGQLRNLSSLKFEEYYDRYDFIEKLEAGRFGRIEVIFHLGSPSDVTETDKEKLHLDITRYSERLFEYCIENDSRFFYTSTAATYGDGSKGFDDQESNLQPLNYYARFKHNFDELVRNSIHKPRQFVCFKFFNVYGPREQHKGNMASMVYHFYKQLKENGEIEIFETEHTVYGQGKQQRDFVYVEDGLKVFLYFLINQDKSGIFNLGTGQPRSFIDLAHSVAAAMGIEPKYKLVKLPQSLRGHYQNFTEADISSLRKAGYIGQFFSLEEGVKDYIQKYLLTDIYYK